MSENQWTKERKSAEFWPACTNTGFRKGSAIFYIWEDIVISEPALLEEIRTRQYGGYNNPKLERVPTAALLEMEKDFWAVQG